MFPLPVFAAAILTLIGIFRSLHRSAFYTHEDNHVFATKFLFQLSIQYLPSSLWIYILFVNQYVKELLLLFVCKLSWKVLSNMKIFVLFL